MMSEALQTPFRRWRERNNLSQSAAAAALDYSRRMAGSYDRGSEPLPRSVALAMLGYEARSLIAQATVILADLLDGSPADRARAEDRALALLPILVGYLDDDEIAAGGGLTPAAATLAASEGWGLFWNLEKQRVEIQRDDARSTFRTDDAALRHVKRRAAAGSRLHQMALALHREG